jgi:hypothetical protein
MSPPCNIEADVGAYSACEMAEHVASTIEVQ